MKIEQLDEVTELVSRREAIDETMEAIAKGAEVSVWLPDTAGGFGERRIDPDAILSSEKRRLTEVLAGRLKDERSEINHKLRTVYGVEVTD